MTLSELLKSNADFSEIAKICFDYIDTDRSGQIDSDELEMVIKKLSNEMSVDVPSKEELKELIEFLDKDRSGKIDFHEFKDFLRQLLTEMMQEAKN